MNKPYKRIKWHRRPAWIAYIKENCATTSDQELAAHFKNELTKEIGPDAEKFIINPIAIAKIRYKNKWRSIPAKGFVWWTPEMKKFLAQYFRKRSDKELASMFDKKFPRPDGTKWRAALIASQMDHFEMNRTYAEAMAVKKRNYDKGLTKPAKRPDKYKIGDIVKQRREDYYTKKEWYELSIKTETGWRLLKHVIWEQHNGPIPKGHQIKMKDGNKLNVVVENLLCEPYNATIKKNQELLAPSMVAGILSKGDPEYRQYLLGEGRPILDAQRARMHNDRLLGKQKKSTSKKRKPSSRRKLC